MRLFALFIFFLIVSASGKVWLGIHSGGLCGPGCKPKRTGTGTGTGNILRGSIRNDISMSVVSFFFYHDLARGNTHIDREASTKRKKRGFFVYAFLACAFGWFCGLVTHGAHTTGGRREAWEWGGLMDTVSLLFHSFCRESALLLIMGVVGAAAQIDDDEFLFEASFWGILVTVSVYDRFNCFSCFSCMILYGLAWDKLEWDGWVAFAFLGEDHVKVFRTLVASYDSRGLRVQTGRGGGRSAWKTELR